MKNLHWSDLPDNTILFDTEYFVGEQKFTDPVTAGEIKEQIPVTLWHKYSVEDLKELFIIELQTI